MKNETKNLFNDEIFPKKKGNNCVFLVASAILKIPNNFGQKSSHRTINKNRLDVTFLSLIWRRKNQREECRRGVYED